MEKIRPIAIYLPQFHPVAENDEWWGKGFTEWTNVTKAKPLFKGHYQPHLPADLGFYDLRLPEARQAQADLAKEYGIHGFCYYHYWFNGKQILERPFEEVFTSGKPEFPFMLCWANENWTRIWNGGFDDVLLEQKYSFQDDLAHIRNLIKYLKDPRYIRIDNKPVFAFYNSSAFPNIEQTLNIWRTEALKHGMELYLCRFESFGIEGEEHLKSGFDAAIEFQPHSFMKSLKPKQKVMTWKDEITFETVFFAITNRLKFLKKKPGIENDGIVELYEDVIKHSLLNRPKVNGYKRYRCVMPSFDNSSRKRKDFFIAKDSSPYLFGYWLEEILKTLKPYSKDENLIFINAWNEWGEGNHLEPCTKWQRSNLVQIYTILQKLSDLTIA